jgi:hypothetical protein
LAFQKQRELNQPQTEFGCEEQKQKFTAESPPEKTQSGMRDEVGGDNFEQSAQPWLRLIPQPIPGKFNPGQARALS